LKIKAITTIVLVCITSLYGISQQKYTLSGQINDATTGEDLISATVYSETTSVGTTSNVYGFYSLTLEEGQYEITYSYLGYENQILTVELTSDIVQNIELGESGTLMSEVVISAEKETADDNVESTAMSVDKVSIETVKKLPALFGEIDIIKTIQLLPGVKSIGEGSSGFYVRGGNVDQNLVLLDEAPIYNASHLLGFFSSFNPDAIKDMQLYKGAMPAIYGGRLSSVLDIRMKEGNSKRFAGSGGIGSIMSRLAIEAPISKNGSFMIAGRRSYLDVMGKAYQRLKTGEKQGDDQFYFYDLNAKTNYRINENNRIFASGYFGRDVFVFKDFGLGIEWGNTTGTMRWNHIFSPKIFSNLTYYYSNYDYFLDFDEGVSTFKWDSKLREHSIKADFGIYINPNNTLKFGIHTILHQIEPGSIKSFENSELIERFDIQKNESYESALYVNNEQVFSSKLKIDYGVRISSLHNIGPNKAYNYDDNYNITDTINYASGVYNSYFNLEPRLGLRYKLNGSNSIKASYNRTTQYIQLASNGNSATPFDIWFPSSAQVKPQLADQVALGYFKNLNDNTVELSAEIYYKKFKNSIDFKDHANLLLNTNLEGDLRIGIGRAYGVELMAKKNKGRLSGWISYTYSKVEKKIATINEGDWYNAKYDKPHDLSIVAAYELSNRLSVGSNFVYSTGSPVTFPTGKYNFRGVAIPIYSERNGARLPDYHRLDLSATLKSKNNKSRRLQTEWVLSVYNVYDRKNAFSINFKQEEANQNITYAEKRSVFSIVPAVTFNAKF